MEDSPSCEKCGSTDIGLLWHKANRYTEECLFGDEHKSKKEHLHYYCRRCHYDWIGPTLAQKNRATAAQKPSEQTAEIAE